MTRGLTARLLLVGGLALLLCAGTFAAVLGLVSDVRASSERLQTSERRTAAANRVLGLIVDAETGLRGYVVTRDERFLEPYTRASASLPGAQRDLLALGGPASLVDASNAYLDLARRNRRAAAGTEGKRQVDRIRALVHDFTVRESAAAAKQREDLDDATQFAVTLAIVALIIIPLIVLLVVLVGTRSVARPLRRLAAAARRLENGELDVRVDENAPAEVGELAHSFNAMAASLEKRRDEAESHNAEVEAQGAELAAAVKNLEHEKERMETIHAVVAALAAEAERDRLVPLILELLCVAARAEVGALYVEFRLEAVNGDEPFPTMPEGALARAIDERRPTIEGDRLHMPLVHSGRAVGAITLGRGEPDIEAIWLMADAAAVALSNALALEAARHQAEANRAVLETAHDAYIAVDDGLQITAWTPQAEALFGYREQEALGAKADQLLIPERWRQGYRDEYRKLITGSAKTRRFQIGAVHRDGRRLQVELSVSPLRLSDGWQVNAFVRDIGAEVARERAREAQRAVSQALAETAANEEVVPHVLEALGRTLRWPVAIHWLPGAKPGATWHDGGVREAATMQEIALREQLRGEPPGRFLVPLSDTLGTLEFRQRRTGPLEPELMQALEDISNFVAEVLERRRLEEEAERLKNEFFALVSHELRTPLTSIIGYVELLLEEEPDELQQRFLGVINRNAHRLQRLVGDLLFVAQVEAGTLSLDTRDVDLEAVVADAVEAGRPRAEQAGIAVTAETEPLPPLKGDPDRLAQVVDNLVTNAIKFTPAGGRVIVRAIRRDGNAVIEVEDTGMGIPAAEQEHLFERFYRTASATERSIPGIGLGLSIVRAIAAGHGGGVAVASEEGRGTTFTVELPIPIHEVTK